MFNKVVIVYDTEDHIIAVLDKPQHVNALINGWMTFVGQDHYEVVES
jgi:hypothetical protein